MNDQDQAYLEKGTEVSAKFKGAFCEAKIKEIDRKLSLKVTFKSTNEQLVVTDQHIKQGNLNLTQLKVGQLIEACKQKPDIQSTDSLANYEPAIINKITDLSIYTVIFNDGDEKNLKRSFLRVKGERHFLQSETLNNSPLTHPEHFLNPVKNSDKSATSTDTNKSPTLPAAAAANNTDSDNASSSCLDDYYEIKAGSVVIVDKKKSANNWYIGIVIKLKTNKDCIVVRNFKTSKLDVVAINDVCEYDHTKILSKCGENQQQIDDLKELLDQVNLYINKNQLPKHIQPSDLNEGVNDTSTSESSSDDNDEYELEKKDRFVAQLYKFMDDRDTPINKIPTIEKTDLDLYKLFMIVKGLGGYNKVNKQKYWLNVYKKLGLVNSSSSNIVYLKSAYKRYLQPYEEFYRKLGSEMLNDTHNYHATIRGSTGSGSVDSSSHRSLHIYKNRLNNSINESKKVYKLKRVKKGEEAAVASGKKLDMSELEDKVEQKEEITPNKEKEEDKSSQQTSSNQEESNQQSKESSLNTSANNQVAQNDDAETTLTSLVKTIDEELKRNRKQQQQQKQQTKSSNNNNNNNSKKKQQAAARNLSVESSEEMIQVDATPPPPPPPTTTIEDTKPINEPDVECDVESAVDNVAEVVPEQQQPQQDDSSSLKRKSKDSSDDQNRSTNAKQARKGLNTSTTVAKRRIQMNTSGKKSSNNDSNNETNSDFTNSSRKSSVNEENNASSTNNNEPTTASTSNTVTLSSLYEDISSPDETNLSSIASNIRTLNRNRTNTRKLSLQQNKADQSSNKSISDDNDEPSTKRTEINSDNSTIEDYEEGASTATTTATVTSTKIDNKNYTINDFEENQVIEVKYGEAKNRKLYQAKIMKINYDDQTMLVHYRGWNTRYDEWICVDRITKIYNGDPNAQRTRKTSVKKYTKVSEVVESKKKNETKSSRNSKTSTQRRNNNEPSDDEDDEDEEANDNGDEEDNVDEDEEERTRKTREKMKKKCENIKKSGSIDEKSKQQQEEGVEAETTIVKAENETEKTDSNEKSVKTELVSIKDELMDVECEQTFATIASQQTQNEATNNEPIAATTTQQQQQPSSTSNPPPPITPSITTPVQIVKKREARSKSVDFEQQQQNMGSKSDFEKDQLKRKLSTSPSTGTTTSLLQQTNTYSSSSQQEPNAQITQTETSTIDTTASVTSTPSAVAAAAVTPQPSTSTTTTSAGVMQSRKKRLLKDLEASNITNTKRKTDNVVCHESSSSSSSTTTTTTTTTATHPNTETSTPTTTQPSSSHVANTNKQKYEIFKPLIKMPRKDSITAHQHQHHQNQQPSSEQAPQTPTSTTGTNDEVLVKKHSPQPPTQPPQIVTPSTTTSSPTSTTTTSTAHSIMNILNSPILSDKIKTNLIIDKQQNMEIIEHEQQILLQQQQQQQQQQIESTDSPTKVETLTLSTTTTTTKTTTITVLNLNPIETVVESKKESHNESDQLELSSPNTNKDEQSENIQPTCLQQQQQQQPPSSIQNQSSHLNSLLLSNNDNLPSTKYCFQSIEKSIFGEERIRLLEEQMKECRKNYLKLKSEIMVIDKKKKRHRRKLLLKQQQQQANQSINKGIEGQIISTPLKQLIDATMVE